LFIISVVSVLGRTVNCLVDLQPITSGAGWAQEGHPARKKGG